MIDPILQEAFKHDRIKEMVDKMNDVKKLNKKVLRDMCNPNFLVMVYERIKNGTYEISPPRIILIPKDEANTYRECKVNGDYDRCVLSLINDALFELTKDKMISKHCTSYQKGLSCQTTVQDVVKKSSKLITDLDRKGYKHFMFKADLSKYFDSVSRDKIDDAFDRAERYLGFKPNTLPSITMLRKYYHSDWLFTSENELVQMYTSLKQGSSPASWLADVILKDLDDKMSEMCDLYVRYSDDILAISKDIDSVYDTLGMMLSEYGLHLNPKKVEFINADQWFTFLGMKIKKEQITLSTNRIHNFQKEIFARSIMKPNITAAQAKQNILNYLYRGEYSWATACLGTINVKTDMDEMNKLIMDCLRLCEIRDVKRKQGKKVGKYSKADIGGLGSVNNLPDRTVLRGKGRKVGTARDRTDKTIQNYLSVGCLHNNLILGKSIYEASIRAM